MTEPEASSTDFDDLCTRPDQRPDVIQLLHNLKRDLPALSALLEECRAHDAEDAIYRFYHGSFKVYRLQDLTKRIVAHLRQVMPERELDPLSTVRKFSRHAKSLIFRSWGESHCKQPDAEKSST
jgi:isocitrate dehydrogenase kinase/phosphatase